MAGIRGILGLLLVLVAVVGVALLVTDGWRGLGSPQTLAREILANFDTPANQGDSSPRTFVVREGETAGEISNRLEASGFLRQALVFRLMAEVEGVTGDLAAGEYELSPSMRPSQILQVLVNAETKLPPLLTIPEGWRSEEIADRLAARGLGTAEEFMKLVHEGRSDSPALASRPPGASLEGYLFPESYRVDSKSTVESIVQRMVEQFEERFTPEMRQKAAEQGMTIHQIVTLASIIEREAVIPAERPLMAGVFYNRLREGMLLQTDPTVQYAIATEQPGSRELYGWWKTTLTAEDLEIDSPYNSYKYAGLPPGPICNPGIASLMAALEPTPTDYLYFVARPDGSHAFARTLEEHNANVALYRR